MRDWVSILSGLVLVLVSASWTLLSREFLYGQGHSDRPILLYLLLYLVAWLAFLFAVLGLFKNRKKPSLAMILTVALFARASLLPSNLLQENDVYRYVLDGQVILHGQNPFEYAPLVLTEMARKNLRESLQSPEAQLVLGRVGYPEIPTIYPPVAQLAFLAGVTLCGWDWMGQRLVFTLIDLLVILALVMLLRGFGLSPSWVIIYAWNPLVLKEISNSAHLDVLVALFLSLLLLGLRWYEKERSVFWLSIAAVFTGLAILSKLYPILLMPACVIYLLRVGNRRMLIQFSTIAAGVVVLGYLPFLSVGLFKVAEGLSVYAQRWRMNDGFFSILSTFFPAPRGIAIGLILLLSFLLPFIKRNDTVEDVASLFQWVLLFWYLIIPTPYPWYAVPLVALAVTRPLGVGGIVTIVLSGAMSLYYLSFFYEYHDYSWQWWAWTRAVEHIIIWLSMVMAWRFFGSGLRNGSREDL